MPSLTPKPWNSIVTSTISQHPVQCLVHCRLSKNKWMKGYPSDRVPHFREMKKWSHKKLSICRFEVLVQNWSDCKKNCLHIYKHSRTLSTIFVKCKGQQIISAQTIYCFVKCILFLWEYKIIPNHCCICFILSL